MDDAVVAALLREFHALSGFRKLAVALLPVLFAITVHEVAHGFVAKLRGDRTAEMLGRLTLNPVKHVDPLGTVIVPLLMLFSTGGMWGWAKPVPVTAENLRGRRRDMAVVALAGPAANGVMAVLWAAGIFVATVLHPYAADAARFLFLMGLYGILFNLIIGVLNLVPIPPLDGGRIVSSLLPGPLAWQYDRVEPYGIFIVFGLLLFGPKLGLDLWGPILGIVNTVGGALLAAAI